MKKRVLAIAATAMATMMMASPVMAQDFKIGICNYVDDASLNQIVDNIQSRLEEIGKEKDVNFDVSYDNCNADANVMEQIISDFQADNVDLMVGVATPVAMRMQSATEGTDTPVVFSAVSDPVGSGLVEDLEAPGANITGTSDYLDTASIMKLIKAVNPDVKKIGLLYDVGQDASTTAIQEANNSFLPFCCSCFRCHDDFFAFLHHAVSFWGYNQGSRRIGDFGRIQSFTCIDDIIIDFCF